MKKILTVAVAALALAAQANSAQAQGRRATPTPTPMTAATPAPWVDPGTSSSSSSSSGDSSMMTAAVSAPAAPGGDRPEGRSFGIGLGYTFSKTGLGTTSPDGTVDTGSPNTASVRIRMPSGLTLEPIVGLGIGADSSKVDTTKSSGTQVDIFAGANVRKPMMSRKNVDLLGIIGGGLDISSSSTKVDTAKTSSTGIGLAATWGLGVEYWPTHHWSLSLDATNPLLNVASTSGKQGAVKTSSTSFFIGGIFDPTVRVMGHLYY